MQIWTPSTRWTPFDFEATQPEKHSNPFGTGNQVVDNLKKDFDFTARETIALMALHGTHEFGKSFEQFLKYKWIGQKVSRLYFKFLNGKKYREGGSTKGNSGIGEYLIGDVNGNPVAGTTFYIDCKGQWKNFERAYPGPCHFRPTQPGYWWFPVGICKCKLVLNHMTCYKLIALIEITTLRLESKPSKGYFLKNKFSTNESTQIYNR